MQSQFCTTIGNWTNFKNEKHTQTKYIYNFQMFSSSSSKFREHQVCAVTELICKCRAVAFCNLRSVYAMLNKYVYFYNFPCFSHTHKHTQWAAMLGCTIAYTHRLTMATRPFTDLWKRSVSLLLTSIVSFCDRWIWFMVFEVARGLLEASWRSG